MTMKRERPKKQRCMSYRAAAAKLGVDVGHLWRVVNGERVSKRLMVEMRKRGIKVEVA